MNMSFGLFLTYNLVVKLREGYNSKTFRKRIEDQEKFSRTIHFSPYNKSDFSDNKVTIDIKRVELTEKFSMELEKTFNSLRSACLIDIRMIVMRQVPNLNTLTEIEQMSKTREILSTEDYSNKLELFDILTKKYPEGLDLEEMQLRKLGIQCVSVLESANILVDTGFINAGVKTASKIKIDEKYITDIYSIPCKPKKLPMVIRPNFWQKNKNKTGNLNYGGYQFNKILNFPGITNHHKKGITVITENDLVNINFVQSNYYNINTGFLEYVRLNFKTVVKNYLRKIPNVEFLIPNLNDFNDQSIRLQSIEELLDTDIELSNYIKQFKGQKNSKLLKRQIKNRRNHLTERYSDVVNLFFGLVHGYTLASNYKGYDFYFTVFLDNRGRFYINSAGAAFGMQAGDFSKSLIELIGNSYDTKNTTTYESDHCLSNKALIQYKNSLKDDDDPFQKIKIGKGLLPTTITNDASCSGTSILSGLIGYKKGLFLTNVIKNSKDNLVEKRSIYKIFLSAMEKGFPKNVLELYTNPEQRIKKSSTKLGINPGELESRINSSLISVKKLVLNINHSKQFLMRKNYSEGNKGRFDYIYETIIIPSILESNQKYGPVEKFIYKSISYSLALWVEKLYYKEFPELALFVDYLIDHFDETGSITLISSTDSSEFRYQQLAYKTVTLPRTSFQKNRNSNLSLYLPTEEFDFGKARRSLVANFVHYLDARLNFLVIDKCRKNSVWVWPNHDCWHTSPLNKPKLLSYYYESYIELLLDENDVIRHFLNANQIQPNHMFEKALNKYKVNRQEIMDNVAKGNFKMSEFILSS